MSTRSREGASKAAAKRGLAAAIEESLQRIVPQLEIADHDVEIADGLTADHAGVDESGRLVFILRVDGSSDLAVLSALDALAFGRHNAALLVQHLGVERLRVDINPRVVLVAESFEDRVLGRLAPLVGDSVELFEVRSIKSGKKSQLYLAPVDGGAPAAAGRSDEASLGAFLGDLAAHQLEAAQVVLDRMMRVDDELEIQASSTGLTWRFRGHPLARLEVVEGHMEGSVPPYHNPRPVDHEEAVETFVEEALARYARLLGPNGGHEEDEDLGVTRTRSAPLMTEEELEAFRD